MGNAAEKSAQSPKHQRPNERTDAKVNGNNRKHKASHASRSERHGAEIVRERLRNPRLAEWNVRNPHGWTVALVAPL